MKLIKPYYEILNENDFYRVAKEIERAARTCYKSEEKICEGSEIPLIEKLISSGHEAMLEFGPSITVRFINDRGISHEEVRHRLCSFAQESTRYCNYSKDKFDEQITYIDITPHLKNPYISLNVWMKCLEMCEASYNEMITAGETPQIARSVLPNSLKTEIVIKANIREWRHIFVQRTSKKAHPQMRELMIPLLKHFQLMCPLLFNDIKIEE